MSDEWWRHARAAVDAANAQDPRRVDDGAGAERAFELVYADRVEHWTSLLVERPSPALAFACRAQHVRRWEVPRDAFPAGRAGYHAWRRKLTDLHVAVARDVLASLGADAGAMARVEKLIRKEGRETDAEAQALQDAVSLVTLELQLGELVAKLPEEKMIDVLRRTLAKMSAEGRALAARIALGPDGQRLLERASAAIPRAGG